MSWLCKKCNWLCDDTDGKCPKCLDRYSAFLMEEAGADIGVCSPEFKALMESEDPNEKWTKLYHAVNLMMCELGAYGTISTRTKQSMDVMDALFEIDGGAYNDKLLALLTDKEDKDGR